MHFPQKGKNKGFRLCSFKKDSLYIALTWSSLWVASPSHDRDCKVTKLKTLCLEVNFTLSDATHKHMLLGSRCLLQEKNYSENVYTHVHTHVRKLLSEAAELKLGNLIRSREYKTQNHNVESCKASKFRTNSHKGGFAT